MAIPTGGHPALLFAYPRGDALFSQLVTRLVRGVRSDGVQLRTARRQLRSRYPNADLNRQREVIVRDIATETWFAYRDGRHRPQLPDTRWWDRRGTARGVVDGAGRITHPNAPFRSLLQVGSPGRGLLTTSDFVAAEVVTILSDPTRQMRLMGSIDSTTTVHRRSGHDVDVEFHLAYDGAGPGHHTLAVRSFAARDEAYEHAAVATSSLGHVASGHQRAILRSATRRELPAGARLAESLTGDSWATLVVAGIVRTYLAADGAEPTLLYGHHGRLLGTHTVASDGSMPVGLQTVTPSRLLLLSPARVAELGRTDQRFARAGADEAIDMVRSVVASYAMRSSATLEQRLARELLLLASMQPSDMLISVTEQQLADGVGSIRESVGRSIASFRRRGWVATTRNGVIVLDADGIRSIRDGPHA